MREKTCVIDYADTVSARSLNTSTQCRHGRWLRQHDVGIVNDNTWHQHDVGVVVDYANTMSA